MAILREGQLLIITGHMGSGKTHFANVLTEGCALAGYSVYTNINYFKEGNWTTAKKKGLLDYSIDYVLPPENVHITNKMSFLLKSLTKTSPNVVILDEAMIFAGYDRTGSKILRWFKDFITQCRKLNTAVILITQVKSQLTKLLREQLEHYEVFCQKIKGEYIVRAYKYYPIDRSTDVFPMEKGPVSHQTLIGHYPYDTKAPASLQMDVDMESFLSDISMYDSIEIVNEIDALVNRWTFVMEPKKSKETKITKEQRCGPILDEYPDLSAEEICIIYEKRHDEKISPSTVKAARRRQ